MLYLHIIQSMQKFEAERGVKQTDERGEEQPREVVLRAPQAQTQAQAACAMHRTRDRGCHSDADIKRTM